VTFAELLKTVHEALATSLPAPILRRLGGQAGLTRILAQEDSLGSTLIVATASACFDIMRGQKDGMLAQLEELSKTCPGAGVEGFTPVKAAAQAYQNAIRVVQHGER